MRLLCLVALSTLASCGHMQRDAARQKCADRAAKVELLAPKPGVEAKRSATDAYGSAVISLSTKNYDFAMRELEECVQADPHFAQCYRGLGNAYEGKFDNENAVVNYLRYLQLKPDAADRDDICERILRRD
jgi:Tfp pilus assembly protein PilF